MKKKILKKGKVSLVGAGPGDVDLLTLKGLSRLQEADVVLYDYLANKELLEKAKKGAQVVYVGKRRAVKTMSQESIQDLMIQEARKGRHVVRLKGGDPFIFGRGGEEALALRNAGIEFEVIPGVSSGLAVPAYAGIPLTHRDYSSEVVFVTGESGQHLNPEQKLQHWQRIAKAQTIVLFMGSAYLADNLKCLVECGLSPQTPAAFINWGTYPKQKTVFGDLSDLACRVQEANLGAPSLVVIGYVVSLSSQLNWFDKLPLFGKRIILTSHSGSSGTIKQSLRNLGADVLECPLGKIKFVDQKSIALKIKKVKSLQWLVLTSIQAIESLKGALSAGVLDLRDLSGLKFAVIGKSSAAKLQEMGIHPDFVSSQSSSEGFVDQFKKKIKKPTQLLYLRGSLSRDVLVPGLKKLGHKVWECVVYQNKPINVLNDKKAELLDFNADAVVMTSSMAVERFVGLWKNQSEKLYWKQKNIFTLGPVTADSLKKHQFKSVTISKSPSQE